MSYYKFIGGIRYEKALLEAAEAFTKGRGEGQISLEEMQQLYKLAMDGVGITDIEKNTLRYIVRHHSITPKALQWLTEQIPSISDRPGAVTERILKEEYKLGGIQAEIPEETVRQYLAMGGGRSWESVLKGALEAFLKGSQGQVSFVATIARQDGLWDEIQDQNSLLKSYLDKAVLYLIPPDAAAHQNLPYDLPQALDTSNFWIFALQIPDFEPLEFFAYVHRSQPFQYSNGQFSRKAPLAHLIQRIVRYFTGFSQLEWRISEMEWAAQMSILPDQNFGNALFSALNTGIFNQESSFSFAGFVREEIWLDPETELSEWISAYVNSGVLHLVPLDYRTQTTAGTADFPIPEKYTFWQEGEWIFGLELPQKTDVKAILSTPREGNDGDTAWSEGFVYADTPLEIQMQKVMKEEFGLEGLELRYNLIEFDLQRQQYGPEWRHLPGLLRQVLNTLFHDYLTRNSLFLTVAERHKMNLDPTLFEDHKAYQAEVRKYIAQYLQENAVLELLPFTAQEEMSFPFGETVADHWLVRAVAENLADHWFWVVIPRWPGDDQRPYNYME